MSFDQRDDSLPDGFLNALRERCRGPLETAIGVRTGHGHDVSHHVARPPQAVLFAESTADVAAAVAACAAHRVPVIPFGTGTAVEGGVVATRGGLCIDLSRMNRILEINATDRDATVQAGVTRVQLNRHLDQFAPGLHFPVDPGADASLGGMAATCASGSAAVRYGTMRHNVLGLTVVLADGRAIRTGGRARKSSSGYDLTRLFVGSEGTLGVITEVTLKLARLPEAISAAVCDFPSIEAAVNCVIDVLSAGVPMARIELLDNLQMAAVNRYSHLDYAESPTLFIEFQGSANGVVEEARQVEAFAKRYGGGEFRWAVDRQDRERLWQARHDAYYASLALRPNGKGFVTDVCVPVSRLAECILRTKSHLRGTRIPAPLYGHVGDGNYHVVFVIDPDSPGELEEVQRISRQITEDALAVGGTCTGEHGIGLGKLDELEREHGAAVDVMRAIKAALDPLELMNPGKVLRARSNSTV
jgi:D-lactate dehydrogenase (cytochrome)